ncbi:NUDIX domain-containing protein [Vibrio vulnificus]|uniref:MutT/nudix family protein n=3 Tax=Vibrio vulnificus TaxID=672 RepID=Q7MEQ5_VIBVY|nr:MULTISPECIES: NUDIX domain-containing protein [Vibrio]EWS70574.1 DNA mismatch repair protein MutT [Vibrio vulnificus BAA87]AAO07080.1 NTP pyrophosphohydrolase [Vibrio vulnificus CMCP6]AIL72676.1 MutT/nudix family protein [Vibrio vulnificus]ALM73009.1 NTP pyrophosphohydrolase [Vibrio vulnificus]AMG10957.1 NUDIX domain-containing protein [Vibrio vulnificus]
MIPFQSHAVSGVALSRFDGQYKILMMKRTKGNYWCHVAGGIEAGEAGWQTIVREFAEETQINVETLYNGQYLEQFYQVKSDSIVNIPVFVVYCEDNQVVTLNDEHTEYRWCDLEQAKSLAEFPGQEALYDHVWQHFVLRSPSPLSRIPLAK